MKTRRLYFEDPYRVEFEAKVLSQKPWKDKWALSLDQTAFYPESGGQPSDKGTLNGIKVTDVFDEQGVIFHVVEEEVKDKAVKGHIEWETRFDHMQQHAGQHILSQCFFKHLKGETRSFHLGEDVSTLEIGLQNIGEKEMEKIEKAANEVVFLNKEIRSYFLEQDRIDRIPLRRPPQKKGVIRVVEIDGFDYSACGGTHPRRTGEIGLIKILKKERIRNNVRFEFVCGMRALKDYVLKDRVVSQVANRFSTHASDLPSSIEKLFLETKELKKECKKLQSQVSLLEAQEIVRESSEKIIKRVFSDKTVDEMRLMALTIIKKPGYIVLFGLKKQERAHLVLARSEGMDLDLRESLDLVSPLIEGKGGGRASLVELSGTRPENIQSALDKVHEFIIT